MSDRFLNKSNLKFNKKSKSNPNLNKNGQTHQTSINLTNTLINLLTINPITYSNTTNHFINNINKFHRNSHNLNTITTKKPSNNKKSILRPSQTSTNKSKPSNFNLKQIIQWIMFKRIKRKNKCNIYRFRRIG